MVVPITKADKKASLVSSYRLISLLSKLAEKIILQQLDQHLDTHKITNDFQFGFPRITPPCSRPYA